MARVKCWLSQNPKNDTNLRDCQTLGTDEEVRRSAAGRAWHGREEMRCTSQVDPEVNLEVRFGRAERLSLAGEGCRGHSEQTELLEEGGEQVHLGCLSSLV